MWDMWDRRERTRTSRRAGRGRVVGEGMTPRVQRSFNVTRVALRYGMQRGRRLSRRARDRGWRCGRLRGLELQSGTRGELGWEMAMEIHRVGSGLGLVVVIVVGVMMSSALGQDRQGEVEPDIGGVVVLVQAVLDALTEVEERLTRVEERLTEVEERLTDLEASRAVSEGYSARFFNVDDVMRLLVNGETALECTYSQPESCYLTREEFERYLNRRENDVAVELTNIGGTASFGYEIRRNGALLYAKSCGIKTGPGGPTVNCGGFPVGSTERLLEFVISVPR